MNEQNAAGGSVQRLVRRIGIEMERSLKAVGVKCELVDSPEYGGFSFRVGGGSVSIMCDGGTPENPNLRVASSKRDLTGQMYPWFVPNDKLEDWRVGFWVPDIEETQRLHEHHVVWDNTKRDAFFKEVNGFGMLEHSSDNSCLHTPNDKAEPPER